MAAGIYSQQGFRAAGGGGVGRCFRWFHERKRLHCGSHEMKDELCEARLWSLGEALVTLVEVGQVTMAKPTELAALGRRGSRQSTAVGQL